ncbi:Hsp20/alpha crystallin family protein [Halobacteria archaeon AArc-dxtr1]|nr:Hsp20/alpha crystallin family protein [Halobacteria archaeon AArc-dxtr1]
MTLRDLTDSIGKELYRQVGRVQSRIQQQRELPVDVLENETGYLVVFDAAGAELADVQVRYVDGTVRVLIERAQPEYDGYEMRFPGRSNTVDGSVDLPADALVDPDDATATLTDGGTLRIEIPKEDDANTDDAPATDATGETETRSNPGEPADAETSPPEELTVD